MTSLPLSPNCGVWYCSEADQGGEGSERPSYNDVNIALETIDSSLTYLEAQARLGMTDKADIVRLRERPVIEGELSVK